MAKMTYEEWLDGSIRLSSNVDMFENELNSVTLKMMDQLGVQRSSNGLLPRELTKSKEYQEANQKFNMAYNLYKEYNKVSPKQYMQRKSQEAMQAKMKQAHLTIAPSTEGKNMYKIEKSSFCGGKAIFSSENGKEISEKLIEIGAYKQPKMMDGGYVLFQNHESINIDVFVKQNLSETEISTALSKELVDEVLSLASLAKEHDKLVKGEKKERNICQQS